MYCYILYDKQIFPHGSMALKAEFLNRVHENLNSLAVKK